MKKKTNAICGIVSGVTLVVGTSVGAPAASLDQDAPPMGKNAPIDPARVEWTSC